MQTIMDKQEKYLRRRFHILLGQAGIDVEGKLDLLSGYGAESSLELNAHELLELCDTIEKLTRPDAAEMDRLRKRLIAAIGAWLRAMRREENINNIKAIACRAGHAKSFNRITKDRLNSLYYAFRNKTKDMKFVDELTSEELSFLTLSN